MNKELIKLAFQLGYNQGCEDLIKQAGEAEDAAQVFIDAENKRNAMRGRAAELLSQPVSHIGKRLGSLGEIADVIGSDRDKLDAANALAKRNGNRAQLAGGAAALAALLAGGGAISSYSRGRKLKKLRNRNLWQRILNK